MSGETALLVAQAVADAEQYKSVYIPSSERGQADADHTYHIWAATENISVEFISDDKYHLAKLAGKPGDK